MPQEGDTQQPAQQQPAQQQPAQQAVQVSISQLEGLQRFLRRNTVSVETRATFEMDDARIFDLNGKGLQVAVVVVN